jgi:hypothetical protein
MPEVTGNPGEITPAVGSESSEKLSAWIEAGTFGECPRCQRTHEDGEGTTLDVQFLPYLDDYGGSGHRDFLCAGCGLLLREDIST